MKRYGNRDRYVREHQRKRLGVFPARFYAILYCIRKFPFYPVLNIRDILVGVAACMLLLCSWLLACSFSTSSFAFNNRYKMFATSPEGGGGSNISPRGTLRADVLFFCNLVIFWNNFTLGLHNKLNVIFDPLLTRYGSLRWDNTSRRYDIWRRGTWWAGAKVHTGNWCGLARCHDLWHQARRWLQLCPPCPWSGGVVRAVSILRLGHPSQWERGCASW
jgi:hypothetical protein